MESQVKDLPIEEDIDDLEEEEEEDEDIEDEEFDEPEEEEFDGESADVTVGRRSGRGLTLKTLLLESILQPGEGSMTINYLGNKFKGDLLSDGRIQSQETGKIFGTPSAWAIYCKKIVNPDKKSGCGWASVRYRGRKLDTYKNNWFRQKRLEEKECEEMDYEEDSSSESEGLGPHQSQAVVEFETLGNKTPKHDMSTMVELTSFQSIGKLQPFDITMSSSAMAVLDVHGHLTMSEVVGYLAGQWDVNNHNLIISHAFPMKCGVADTTAGKACMKLVLDEMEQLKLSLVGWYHTHPSAPPLPTLRDIETQLNHEMRMKGYSDSSYTPVIGLIAAPYQKSPVQTKGLPHLIGNATGYWVMPQPENRPHEFGRPLSMEFTVVKDAFIPQEALVHMDLTIKYYQSKGDILQWTRIFQDDLTYWAQLLKSLKGKVPKDHYPYLVDFLRRTIGGKLPEEEPTPVVVPLPATPETVMAKKSILPAEDKKPQHNPPEYAEACQYSIGGSVPPKSYSPQFQPPLPPLFPMDSKPEDKKPAPKITVSEIATPPNRFLDLGFRTEADGPDSNFGLSAWFAKQKYTQDVYAIPAHDSAAALMHPKVPLDIPSKWNTGLNLGKQPTPTSDPLPPYPKTPNFSFSLDPKPLFHPGIQPDEGKAKPDLKADEASLPQQEAKALDFS